MAVALAYGPRQKDAVWRRAAICEGQGDEPRAAAPGVPSLIDNIIDKLILSAPRAVNTETRPTVSHLINGPLSWKNTSCKNALTIYTIFY